MKHPGLCFIVFLALAPDCFSGTLDDLIDDIRSGERLFCSVDVQFRRVVSNSDPKAPMGAVKDSEETRRIVVQGTKYRYISRRVSTDQAGVRDEDISQAAYDGSMTRIADGKIVNIKEGDNGYPVSHLFSLHTWAMEDVVGLSGPLSEYLDSRKFAASTVGNDAVGGIARLRKSRIRHSIERQGEVDRLPCTVVRSDFLTGDEKTVRHFTRCWVCPDRHFMVCRYEGYNPAYSVTRPVTVCTLEDFRETEPGIFFPFRRSHSVYRPLPTDEGVPGPLQTTVDTVLHASASPNHSPDFFSSIDILPNSITYRINLRGEFLGNDQEEGLPSRAVSSGYSWVVFVLSGLGVIMLVSAFIVRKKQGRHR